MIAVEVQCQLSLFIVISFIFCKTFCYSPQQSTYKSFHTTYMSYENQKQKFINNSLLKLLREVKDLTAIDTKKT